MTSRVPWLALAIACAPSLGACDNRVNSTRQCLGSGGTTKTYSDYTFEIEDGPAIDVAGDCHVILERCKINAPEGIRATENAVVTVIGGTLVARGAAVIASGDAKISFEGTAVTGTINRSGGAQITGLAPR